MSQLVVLVKPLLGYMVIAITMGVLGFLCAEFITIFGGYAILEVLNFNTGIPLKLSSIFVWMVVFAIARGFLRYGEQSCNHYIAFKLLALIRDRVFQALRKLCPAKLEGRDRGDLISVITSDIELLEVFYAHTISPIVIALIMTIIMVCYIGKIHWLLGVVSLMAYVSVGVVVPVVISKRSGNSGMKFRKQSGELSSFVLESLYGLNETMQYHFGKRRLDELTQRTELLSKQQEKLSRSTGFNQALTNTIILSFDVLMLVVSVLLLQSGSIQFDGVVISVVSMMSSFGAVVALANLGSTLQNTLASGNRVLDILEEQPITEEVSTQDRVAFTGAECQNVTFSYSSETILDNFSIAIPQNEIVGISGKSGSGKSTLLKLLMRFWEVDQGEVKISNTNIDYIDTHNLRDLESFMTQNTHLFHDTIENNIKIGNLNATHQQVVEACKKASLHEFILTLPNGYETQVGELGETLSGGERQRVGLARAFLHDSPFMLLDEPTSNLDSLNEAIILKSIKEETANKSVVLVSHRESTMRIADREYSMHHGRMC
jgi:ATP-binding cassette subfamily C protein